MHRARWAHVFFPVRRWLKVRGGRGRRRRRRSKRRKNDSAGVRRWFCRRFLAAGKQHIILYVAGACLGASLVMRVFAYALPTFRLRGAYAGELLYFRILAMQTSRLETLQKRERNSSISFCFSAKQLLSSNYLCFLDSGNFTCPHRATLIRPFNLDPQAAKFVESAVAYAASAAKWSKICLRQPTHPSKLPTSNHVQVNFHINLYL